MVYSPKSTKSSEDYLRVQPLSSALFALVTIILFKQ